MHRNMKIRDKTNESQKKKNDKTSEAALSISYVNLGKFYSYWIEDL